MQSQRFSISLLLRAMFLCLLCTSLLSGCAATSMAISKKNLDVQTKMNKTLWLNPVPDSKKTIYINLRNTSDKSQFNLNQIRSKLQAKGYRITTSPYKAHYWLQVNILKVGRSSVSAAQAAYGSGPGSALGGAAVGAATGALIAPASPRAWLGAGLAGAAVGLIANSAVKDVTYVAITDIRISERKSRHHYQHYARRVVSTAEKVNLKFEQAFPALEKGLIDSISGVF